MDLSSKLLDPSIMLGHESFCFDCFDEVESLIPISFINSVDKYDYAYLLTFK